MKRNLLIALALAMAIASSAAFCGENGSAKAGSMPANQWKQITKQDLGVRSDAAVVWLAKQKRFMVLCGLIHASKGSEGKPYEVQTFDPAKPVWVNYFPTGKQGEWGTGTGPSKAPGFKSVGTQYKYICARDTKGNIRLEPLTGVARYYAFDPLEQKVYVCLAGHHLHNELARKRVPLFCYDVRKRSWEIITDAPPPVDAKAVYGGVKMGGAAMVFDPVNKELLFLGGQCPGAPRGSIGHWAFNVNEKKWRKLTGTSKLLDPLCEKVLAAKGPTRDAMAAARNTFYKCLPAGKEAPEIKTHAAKLAGDALKLAEVALVAITACKANGREAQAVARAKSRVAEAIAGIKAAASGFDGGQVNAKLLKGIFDAAWALDEAAACLASLPGLRRATACAYDPESKSIILFGGEHGDYLLSDTWIYDCVKKSWRQIFPDKVPPARAEASMFWLPGRKAVCMIGGGSYVPKFVHFRRNYAELKDCWIFDVASGKWSAVAQPEFDPGKDRRRFVLGSALAAGDGDAVLGLAVKNYGYRKGYDASTWLMRVGDPDAALTASLGVPAAKRTYMTVVKEYDPRWYDAAPRGDTAKTAAWIAGLKPNTWTRVPTAARPCPKRDWGTAMFDPGRDQVYHWTGGHMADPASIVSTYHPGTNRWSIPYVGEYLDKGITFNGRPDCMNHTYLNYAYDLKSKKLVFTSAGGTSVYDPDRREFEAHIVQPFISSHYFTKTVGTRQGVICWDRGYWGILDVKARKWKKLPLKGKLPPLVHGDCNNFTYDSKRDCVWLGATKDFSKGSGQMWHYDMKSGEIKAADPAGMEKLAWMNRIRETVYLPRLDLILFNVFPKSGGQMAYDPAGNRWVTLGIPKSTKGLGGVGIGLMYDARRDLVWATDGGKRMHVLKINSKSLKITE
jgi:Galactose oxidase, central domain